MRFFYSSVFFAGTTAIFIVLWVKARQDAKDWRNMTRVGFELAIEEMEKDARKPGSPPAQKVNVVVRERRWN